MTQAKTAATSDGTVLKTEGGPVREIVSFRIADQDYCIDIMNIREIRGWTAPTPLPHAPAYVCGLINLRGSVLPIVDLAQRLGLTSSDAAGRGVIIVVMIEGSLVGMVVDGVSDILTVRESDIQPTPSVGAEGSHGYVQGIMPIDGRMIRLLDLKRVLPPPNEAAA